MSAGVQAKVIRLYMDMEGFYDSGWDCERTYYFARDAQGNRYSMRCELPNSVWTLTYLTPLDKQDYGYTLDDEVDFGGGDHAS